MFEYNKKGSEVKGCLKILILKKIKIYTLDFPSQNDNEPDKEDKDEKNRDVKELYELAKPCLKDLLDYLKNITSKIKIAKINNHIVFGVGSFADTGKYIGIIWSVLAVINSFHEKLEISAEPSFNGAVLDGYGDNEVEIYPLKLIIPTIKLISKKEVRNLIRGVIDAR
ncbi:DUF2953 domain-containing protein [Methanobrevibacter sp.]